MSDAQAQAWESEITELATTLRGLGIDVDVDLYHLDDVDVDWTRYGPEAIQRADFILIAASRAWRERWEGSNRPTEGAGAAAEADALKGMFNQNQRTFQQRVKVVLLESQDPHVTPPELARLQRYRITSSDRDSALSLVRMLTGQPTYVKPPLGAIPILPPAFEQQLGTQARKEQNRGLGENERMLKELRRTDHAILQLVEAPRSRSLDADPLSGADLAELPQDDRRQIQKLLQRRSALQGILDAITQEE